MTATDAATQATRGPRDRRRSARGRPAPYVLRQPVGQASIRLSIWTWLYIIWSIALVVIVVQFSFNAGRSRSTFQGFSTQWYEAIWNEASENFDETLLPALMQSLKLALAHRCRSRRCSGVGLRSGWPGGAGPVAGRPTS